MKYGNKLATLGGCSIFALAAARAVAVDPPCADITGDWDDASGYSWGLGTGTWTNSAGHSGAFNMTSTCRLPTETTPEFLYWGGFDTFPTAANFNQKLQSLSFNWGGRRISETFPEDGEDTCYFEGGQYSEVKKGNTKAWVLPGNLPTGFTDQVGAAPELIVYFRNKGKTPCGYYLRQTMSLDCQSGDEAYLTHNLWMEFYHTQIRSKRGVSGISSPWGPASPETYVAPVIFGLKSDE